MTPIHRPERRLFRAALGTLGAIGSLGPPAAQAEATQPDTIIVTGTRSSGATQRAALSPISVIAADELARTGLSDLASALAAAEPSLNLPRAATTASSANTRPITLLGQAPDQVLVLINGKRTNSSAVLNFNNAVGRGSAPFDLNSLPLAAVQRIEVLKSGAAAQYGSDAIAGVVNIILKSNAQGGQAALQWGRSEQGDGAATTLQASTGLALGEGHLTLSAQLLDRDGTNRAGINETVVPPRVTFVIGDPQVRSTGLAADAGLPLGEDGQLYASLIVSQRHSTSAAQYRAATVAPALYPLGFVPRIAATLDDARLIAGYRHSFGTASELDLGFAGGKSDAAFQVQDTANVTLGAASPSRFDGGGLHYRQDLLQLGLRHALGVDGAQGSLAAGIEHRVEHYAIDRAEPAAFQGSGAQGFPGLNPRLPVDAQRSATSAYADLEWKLLPVWTASAALRHDRYQDFGAATAWKLATRFELTPQWALRASTNTGFRAPSLQQQYFSSVTSASSAGRLVNVGTYQVRDPVARALGATDLRAETSRHASLGGVWSAMPGLWLSADAWQLRVRDRIVLSDQLGGASVLAVLAAAAISDVQQAQFFTNAADTRTRGVDISLNLTQKLGEGQLNIASNFSSFRTRLDRLAPNPVLPALPLLGNRALLLLTEGQPRSKWLSTVRWTSGDWQLQAVATRYGRYTGQPVTSTQTFDAKWLGDLSLRWQLQARAALTLAVQNLGDVYPDKLVDAPFVRQGFFYGEESPFGTAGRSFSVRLDLQW